MKTLLLLFAFVVVITQSNLKAQTNTYPDSIQYLVGTDTVPGYKLTVCSYPSSKIEPIKKFGNGQCAPILQMYVTNKNKYIGGILENEKGAQTIIKDITLTEDAPTLVFTVVGKDFSMSFNLNSGAILKEEEVDTVFYTENVGPWKINKKN